MVLVTYNDANAYCQWRSRKDKDGKKYRLPTSKEWEKAARGSDGWLYPWGDEPDFARCNTKESGMGGTTSVTKYPEGVSPHGCRDMAGNVWEWTDTKIGQKYMLRGGSWYQQIEYARCAYEFLNYPNYWSTKIGFRCVAEQK